MSPTAFVDEAEAYDLLERAGLNPPRHAKAGGPLPFETGEPVVVKGLGENVWHKSELGAVHFLPFEKQSVIDEVRVMRQRLESGGHRWLDGLVCEQIDVASCPHLPSEGFVSLAHGEAGWTLLFGFGGMQADALAELAPPLRWPLAFTRPEQALAELEHHLLGRIWLGRVRGTHALTTRAILGRFLASLWNLAAVADAEGLVLLELNPVALDLKGEPRPLDAVGTQGPRSAARVPPPAGFLDRLRQPRRIALAGVSTREDSVGRIILENLRHYGLPPGDLVLVKPGRERFLGLPCVAEVGALRAAPVDLLVLALPAPAAVGVLMQLIAQGGGAAIVALTCGGIGDGADTAGFGAQLSGALCVARAAGRWTPAVLGPNFLGHWVPGRRLDTSFIAPDKLPPPPHPGGELTLLGQSGAFLLSRRSRAPELRFGLGLALGNQLDVALCDVLAALAAEPGPGPVAAYIEGFGPGQLLPAAHAIRQLGRNGRRVVLHRAARTEAGQAAAASHTGAMAGNLSLERGLLERAGANFAGSIDEFDCALRWLGAHPQLKTGPVALLTNAGFESVNGGDLFDARLPLATLSASTQAALASMLTRHELGGLVAPRLPLDLTPMASEGAFLDAAELLLPDAAALVVGLVPFTRNLDTTAAGGAKMAAVLAHLTVTHGKPIGVVVDSGVDYAAYRHAFAAAGLPVFDRVESALRGLRVLA
ncbi:MAG TPA: CoA-binding protein [Lacunisphaera sp.]|nr:CoA-binding protein [Lacunisphaera sp.]